MKLISQNLKQKLGGSHTTIIGGRNSYKIINNICKHEKIKSIIPSIICYKNNNKKKNIYAKIQRPDCHGNLRLLLSVGSSYQEIRLITNVMDLSEGECLQKELNKLIENIKL